MFPAPAPAPAPKESWAIEGAIIYGCNFVLGDVISLMPKSLRLNFSLCFRVAFKSYSSSNSMGGNMGGKIDHRK